MVKKKMQGVKEASESKSDMKKVDLKMHLKCSVKGRDPVVVSFKIPLTCCSPREANNCQKNE